MGNRLVRDLGIGSCAVQTERGHTSRQYEGTGKGLVRAGIVFPDILVLSMSPTRGGNIIIVR